jgi:coenzyme PQQ precursor peptide PqqA
MACAGSWFDRNYELWSITSRNTWRALVLAAYFPAPIQEVGAMSWSKPEFIELRFGFEVTMYIWSR